MASVHGKPLSESGPTASALHGERELPSSIVALGLDSVQPLIQKVAESRGNLLLLLDEFEKAYPDFRTAFLSVMDEFATTEELLPMHSSVIVLTSNTLREEVREPQGIVYDVRENAW